MKTTLRDIRRFQATDITTASDEYLDRVLPHRYADTIAYSVGVYGVTGKVIRNTDTGELFKITARSTNIFKY